MHSRHTCGQYMIADLHHIIPLLYHLIMRKCRNTKGRQSPALLRLLVFAFLTQKSENTTEGRRQAVAFITSHYIHRIFAFFGFQIQKFENTKSRLCRPFLFFSHFCILDAKRIKVKRIYFMS